MTAPRYDQGLNAVRYSRADPAAAIAAATLVVALADARNGSPGAKQWLSEGGAGARWAEMLGADELLADVLAEFDGRERRSC